MKMFSFVSVLFGVACATPVVGGDTENQQCVARAQEVLEALAKGSVQYYEGYAYGVSIDTVTLKVVERRPECLKCVLDRIDSDSSALKLHLALSAMLDGKTDLDNYELVESNRGDLMQYSVGAMTWNRPVSSYREVTIVDGSKPLQSIWANRLPAGPSCGAERN